MDHTTEPYRTANSRRLRTLADIMASVKRAPNIAVKHRRAMTTSLNTVARVLGKPLSEIPAQPGALRNELTKATPFLAGVTKRRWIDVRSLTLKALQLGGVQIMPGRRRRSSFSPAWTALRSTINGRYQMGLSRLMNFCSIRQIEPDKVDATTFAAFHQVLLEESLVPHAESLYRETCRLWDGAGRTHQNWPAFRVGPLPEVRRWARDWSSFPESFRQDVESFLGRAADDDIYAPGREYFRPLRPATIESRRRVLSVAATALVESGFPIEGLVSLAVLVKPENARKVLQFCYRRAGKKKTEGTYTKALLMRAIARNWVKNSADVSELDKLCRAAALGKKGMPKRNRDRLRQFDDPRKVYALLSLPDKLMRLARQHDIGDEQAARNAMCAVAIEILTVAPMRIKNVAELELHTNVILPRDPKSNTGYISVPAHQVKNGIDLEFTLPKRTILLIQEYLRDFRPRLSDIANSWLFPNTLGCKRNTVGFSRIITAKLAEHAGLEMHAHLFRHAAIKLMQTEYPDATDSWRRLLGHTTIETTLRYYAEQKTDLAHRRYTDLIESRREDGLLSSPPSSWRKL